MKEEETYITNLIYHKCPLPTYLAVTHVVTGNTHVPVQAHLSNTALPLALSHFHLSQITTIHLGDTPDIKQSEAYTVGLDSLETVHIHSQYFIPIGLAIFLLVSPAMSSIVLARAMH